VRHPQVVPFDDRPVQLHDPIALGGASDFREQRVTWGLVFSCVLCNSCDSIPDSIISKARHRKTALVRLEKFD
jgi:hypothetical protein